MVDRSMEFTGNLDWAAMGKPMDPSDHPATNMPTATEHHDGTVLETTPRADVHDMVNRGRISYQGTQGFGVRDRSE